MKKSDLTKTLLRAGIVSISSFIICMTLYFTNVFSFFENKTYDMRMIFASKYVRASEDIFFIEVDQESIEWAEEEYGWNWPWPREAYAKIIDFFTLGNVNTVAFDILFSEPSIYGPEDDEILSQAAEKNGNVIFAQFISGKGERLKIQEPVTTIKNSAAALGNTTSVMDKDDVIRRGRLEYKLDDTTFPTLGTAPLYLGGKKSELDKIPRLKDGSVLLRFQRNMNSYFPYHAKSILSSYDAIMEGREPDYQPEDFEDGYVYVAYYAPGLFDFCSTPVSQVFPGVGIHITTLDNYLNNNFMKKVPDFLLGIWTLFVSVVGTAFVIFASTRKSQLQTVLYMIFGFIIGLSFSIAYPYVLFAQGYWLQLLSPSFAFLISYILTLGLSMSLEGKQKRFIRAAFSQCLSKEVVDKICDDPSSFKLGGEVVDMTAIFTDIQKFSSFSELLSAEELGDLLNYYLTIMSDIIMEEGGTIDKYEGDAIIALVGAPLKMDDHAERACRAAIKLKKAEIELNKNILEIASNPISDKIKPTLYSAMQTLVKNNKTIFTRIGINSGDMIAGFFGAEGKKNFTMMGNNVNLTSRLEGVNKQYHTNGILISEATKSRLNEDFIVRSLDRVRVVNVDTPIKLYELLDLKSLADNSLISYVEKWECAISDFENKNYKSAYEQLKKLETEKPEDNVNKYYLNLLENYFLKDKYPTQADNEGVAYIPEDGVFKLLQK